MAFSILFGLQHPRLKGRDKLSLLTFTSTANLKSLINQYLDVLNQVSFWKTYLETPPWTTTLLQGRGLCALMILGARLPRAVMLLVGPFMANRFEVTGQTKGGSPTNHGGNTIEVVYVFRIGIIGAPLWTHPWGWGSQASGWWLSLCPVGDVGSCRLSTRRSIH